MHVTCSCAKYETYGILCKHSLCVMKKRHVDTLSSHYILPRWTLNARYKVGKRSIGLEEINNKNGVSAYTLWCARSNFNKLLQEQAIQKKPISVENVSQGSCVRISQVDMMPQLSVRDPLVQLTQKGVLKFLKCQKNEHALNVKDWVIMLLVVLKERYS
uniref:SWIM-type domain-containing protein n=1 Tax=Lactuca sativa TaxID=4236 RepID=A0A9R1UCM7_LACSA|nr:hypothetical protein LSAT_V11C900487770 [Lactuca sativa]